MHATRDGRAGHANAVWAATCAGRRAHGRFLPAKFRTCWIGFDLHHVPPLNEMQMILMIIKQVPCYRG
eukprot:3464180-Prymnesium_polylepis.1